MTAPVAVTSSWAMIANLKRPKVSVSSAMLLMFCDSVRIEIDAKVKAQVLAAFGAKT
jgi:hypothetical protein